MKTIIFIMLSLIGIGISSCGLKLPVSDNVSKKANPCQSQYDSIKYLNHVIDSLKNIK